MNTAKAFVAIAMMGMVVASCSSDSASESTPVMNQDVIQFATNAQPIIQSKAVNNPDNLQDKKFLLNEPINVYLTKNGTGELILPHGETSITPNTYYKFTVGAAYTGTGSTENSQILTAPNNYVFQYPGTDGVDVYALHPATADANVDKSSTSFSVKEDQTADEDYIKSDLISATAANKTKADGTIMLTFAHKLSKVIVKLQADETENLGLVLDGAKISINGNKTVALTHETQADGSTLLKLGAASDAANIVLGEYDETNGTAGIIIPQTAPKDQKLIQVTLANGATFSYTPADDETFEAEKEYVYTLTLKAELLTLVSVEIKPWTTVQRTGDAILD